MQTEAAFLHEILSAPLDPTPRLVYADWLEESGDPRAELIRIQDALRKLEAPDRDSLEARMQSLLHQGVLLAPPVVRNSVGMNLALIPPGEYLKGSPDSEPLAEANEKPQRQVAISEPFLLGIYPVTQKEMVRVVGSNPSSFRSHGPGTRPVDRVPWFGAIRFCNRLSRQEGLPPYYDFDIGAVRATVLGGNGYRLPTEDEWEYACRAGTTTRWSFGDDIQHLDDYAWYAGNAGRRTHAVGTKHPNPWGLFDTHGNVWEHCWDVYRQEVDQQQIEVNEDFRVLRGGSFLNQDSDVRSACRGGFPARTPRENIGFRVARNYP